MSSSIKRLVALFKKDANEQEDGPRSVNIFLGFFFMINIVLGTGFLSIPYGFYHSGILPSIFTLLFITFLSWLTANWVVEAMARAQAYIDYKEHKDIQGASDPHFYISMSRKFEQSEMCFLFAGQWLKLSYIAVIVLLTFISVATYSTVAGSAWSVNIPFNFWNMKQCHDDDFRNNLFPKDEECGNAYRFCVFMFACIVIFLSVLPLKEQAIVQVILGLLRFFTIGAIVIYCLVKLFSDDIIDNCSNPLYEPDVDILNISNFSSNFSIPIFNEANSTETFLQIFLKFNGRSWMVSVALYSFAAGLSPAVPALTHPIKRKEWLRGYLIALYLTIGFMYLILGIVVSLWFKDCIVETCTLNWEPLSRPGRAKELRALSYIIILFPSIDVCSAFPLAIHIVANNLYTVIFGKDTTEHKTCKFFFFQFLLKLMTATLPFAVSMFVANLVTIVTFAGLFGYFLSFYYPIILQILSQWTCYKTFAASSDQNLPRASFFNFMNCISDTTTHADMPKNGTETKPLLIQPPPKTSSNKLNFFTDSRLYYTPYSIPFLSSPAVVIAVGIVTFSFLILTIVSLII